MSMNNSIEQNINAESDIKPAFIIGNGKSRLEFDLFNLKSLKWPTFGCNALYRDFEPDYLVAIDEKIIKEITTSGFDQTKTIFPPEKERYEPKEMYEKLGYTGITATPRSNAGMNAILEAIKLGHNHLILFGFDFLIVDDDKAISNVYEGTNAYGSETHANIRDTRNRIRFLQWIVSENSKCTFLFLYPKNTSVYSLDMKNFIVSDYNLFLLANNLV